MGHPPNQWEYQWEYPRIMTDNYDPAWRRCTNLPSDGFPRALRYVILFSKGRMQSFKVWIPSLVFLLGTELANPLNSNQTLHHAACFTTKRLCALANRESLPAAIIHTYASSTLTSVASKSFKMEVCNHYLRLLFMAIVSLDVAILGAHIDKKITAHKFSTQHRWKRSTVSGTFCSSTHFSIHCCR